MSEKKAKSGGGSKAGKAVKGFFLTLGRLISTMMMVGIITGCIVACVMTVYILRYIGADNEIDLDEASLGYTTFIYATNSETGEVYELQRLYQGGENRIWINYENINEYTRNAIVAIEDKRFWDHSGVDWRRTVGAFVGMFVPIEGTTSGGGSTITQQLVKNVTGDNANRVDRKVREMFRALNLSQRYSREEILEAYLNVVPLGRGTNGIQAAANLYFDKDAKDLTLAESAAIVGITKYPGRYDPFVNPDKNKERQEHVLYEMHEQGWITDAEYEAALAETLNFQLNNYVQQQDYTQSYFVDYVFEQVVADLMEQKGYTYAYAVDQIYRGGYRIYTTVDERIQTILEEVYSSEDNFPAVYNSVYPQSACVITDPHGKIVAMVGGIGEKSGARVLNRATSRRQPGSSIKPLAAYALSIEYDIANWSSKFDDNPILLEEPGKAAVTWPRNYYGNYYGMMTVDEAIQRSTNTIPVKLVQILTPRRVFDFLTNDLQFDSLVESEVVGTTVVNDVNLSAMALGGTTYGVTPIEMVGGYQMYANGGQFTKPYAYTKVEDSAGRTVLQTDTIPYQILGEDTATVINKLLQRVTTGEYGTGRNAHLGSMPTAGKTGTSSDDVDQWFIGMTPYYVCSVWLGYDEKTPENNYGTIGYGTYGPPVIFKNVMAPIHEGLEYANFFESTSVVSRQYCTATGLLAGPGCPVGTGWYKMSRLPSTCTGNHVTQAEGDENGPGSGSSSGGSSSGSSGNSGSSGSSGDDSNRSIFDRITVNS